MEQTEIEQLVGEAENRVERLRSLYDQYFMGLERIEPQIARKDVERRIQMLRKTQIRNTALRFRFQNVLLRYNTFSAHWMRICRQIEEGTYKHHLRRAKERFDPAAGDARDARARQRAAALEVHDTEPPAPGSLSFVVNEDVDVDVTFDDGLDAPDTKTALRAPRLPNDASKDGGTEKRAASEPAKVLSGGGVAANPAKTPPATAADTARAPAVKAAAPPLPIRGVAPPLPGRAAPPVPAGAHPAAASPAKAPPPLPHANRSGSPPSRPPPAPKHAPTGSKPAPDGASAKRVASAAPSPSATPAHGPSKPAPTNVPPVTRPPPRAKSEADALSDERVRQIYSKYVETRRSLKESTAAITMDSMARSLRASSEKLRQKHAGKAVDFEVQVKDGKTVLKPIVK